MRDFEIPARYLRMNYEREDWLAVVLIHRASASLKQEFAAASTIAAPHYRAYLRSANASGADVYLTVNRLKPSVSSRKKSDVETVRHIFLDLDGGGQTAVDRVVKADGMPNPHHILCTSPDKHQILWSVEGFEKDQAEALIRAMAKRFGADQAVWDVARVLRVPGFRNHKYRELRHFVKDIQENPPDVMAYKPNDFPKFVEREEKYPGVLYRASTSPPKEGISQSERDWAYVMKELKRGVDPGQLQLYLEQSRQDKPNPRYYAHRTITQAVRVLARSGPLPPDIHSTPRERDHNSRQAGLEPFGWKDMP